MASVFRRAGTKYFHADFTDIHGVRRHRSTKVTNRKEAEKIALQFEEAARKKRTLAQVKQVISDLHEQLSGEKVKTISLSEFTEAWLKEKEPETKTATMESYRTAVTRFKEFVGTRDQGDIFNISRALIVEYRGKLLEMVTPSTTNHHLKCIKMLFRAAKRSGIIAEDPAESVDPVKKTEESIERKPLSLDDIKKVLGKANEEWKSMILVGVYTGQRLSDIAKLEWSAVNFETDMISLVATKTGRRMTVPIAPPLKAHLSNTAKENRHGHVHPKAAVSFNKGGKSNNLSKQFGKLLEAAGIRKTGSLTERRSAGSSKRKVYELTFHSFRHSAVSLLKEQGADQATVMEIVGHNSAQMSAHYTHVSEKSMKEAAAKLPDVLKVE